MKKNINLNSKIIINLIYYLAVYIFSLFYWNAHFSKKSSKKCLTRPSVPIAHLSSPRISQLHIYLFKTAQRIRISYVHALKNPYVIIIIAEHRKLYERNCGISQTHNRYDLRTQETRYHLEISGSSHGKSKCIKPSLAFRPGM